MHFFSGLATAGLIAHLIFLSDGIPRALADDQDPDAPPHEQIAGPLKPGTLLLPRLIAPPDGPKPEDAPTTPKGNASFSRLSLKVAKIVAQPKSNIFTQVLAASLASPGFGAYLNGTESGRSLLKEVGRTAQEIEHAKALRLTSELLISEISDLDFGILAPHLKPAFLLAGPSLTPSEASNLGIRLLRAGHIKSCVAITSVHSNGQNLLIRNICNSYLDKPEMARRDSLDYVESTEVNSPLYFPHLTVYLSNFKGDASYAEFGKQYEKWRSIIEANASPSERLAIELERAKILIETSEFLKAHEVLSRLANEMVSQRDQLSFLAVQMRYFRKQNLPNDYILAAFMEGIRNELGADIQKISFAEFPIVYEAVLFARHMNSDQTATYLASKFRPFFIPGEQSDLFSLIRNFFESAQHHTGDDSAFSKIKNSFIKSDLVGK